MSKGSNRRPEKQSKILSRWPFQEQGESKDEYRDRMNILKELAKCPERTLFQCAARGCDGCLVCEPDSFTEEERTKYAEHMQRMRELKLKEAVV